MHAKYVSAAGTNIQASFIDLEFHGLLQHKNWHNIKTNHYGILPIS